MEPKKAYKSFRYPSVVVWRSARRGEATAAGKPPLNVGNPPEFRGEESDWPPEHLFVVALNACLMLTFLNLAERRGVELKAYQSSAEGLLEFSDGRYRITTVTVRPKVTLKTSAGIEVARELMGKVEEQCFISNSITSKVDLQPEFSAA
jgi:organic hydroperoxide reductase OsmC/OhrA